MDSRSYLGRSEKFSVGLAKEKRLIQMVKEKQWDAKDAAMVCSAILNSSLGCVTDVNSRRSGSLTSGPHM